jgi:hypothetical protein
MRNDEDKKQLIDPMVNIVFISNLQMSNNGSNVGFGIEKSINEMLGILIELTTIFFSSLKVLTQS